MIFGIVVRVLNIKFFLNVKHKYKIWLTISLWCISICLLVISKLKNNFWLSLLGAVFVGIGEILGECTIIGFMKCFPPIMVSGYSTGTGVSGIISAILYLGFKICHISFISTVLLLLIFYPIYGICFYLTVKMQLQIQRGNSFIEIQQMETLNHSIESSHFEIVQDNQDNLEEFESKINQKLSCSLFISIFGRINKLYIFLFIIYLCEYISLSSFSSQIKQVYIRRFISKDIPQSVYLLFEILQLSYHFGIFTSRSSLNFVKVKRVWLIVLFIFIFSSLFFLQTFQILSVGIWLPILNIYFIGCCGGLGFVNIFYQVLCHPKIKKSERELAINFNGFMSDSGIVCSSLIGFFMFKIWTT